MLMEEVIDRDSHQKLYVQIQQIIKKKIEKGEWPVGKLIPTEDELCKIFDVSKATIRLAIYELVRAGYLKRQQGKGTFVTYSGSHFGIAMKTRLTEDLLSKDVIVTKKILKKEIIKQPTVDIQTYFENQNEIYYITCEGFFDDEPVYIEEFFIPTSLMHLIHNEDFCQTSLYEQIQSNSVKKIFKIIQTIEVIEVNKEFAEYLNLQLGCHALRVHSLLLGSDSTVIAYIKLTGSGKKYKIQTEFEKIS
ncbi:MAG: GntR family transcriptional regulator [Thermodesulfovibrionales bacterium]|nr:GntR family transcriptional regulator [Thermodesulfovibrionales bacterium]